MRVSIFVEEPEILSVIYKSSKYFGVGTVPFLIVI